MGNADQQRPVYIGNSGITAAATLTATAVNNSDLIYLISGTAAATLKDTGAFGNTDYVDNDNGYNAAGGSILTVGGTLTNSASFYVGNTGLTKATIVTAAGLANTGTSISPAARRRGPRWTSRQWPRQH